MGPHVLCVGGEDHALRIPFLEQLRERGFRVTAAGTGDAAPFLRAGIAYRGYRFDRFINPAADWTAMGQLQGLFAELRPDLVQSFDTKPNLLVPFAARGSCPVVRTINGMGAVFSTRKLSGRGLQLVYALLQRLASRWTDATVFQNGQDKAFFERHRLVRAASASRLIAGSGVDVRAFEEAQRRALSAAASREQLGITGSEVVITVGRLTRQKGIPTLLEAAARVHAARPGVRFLLVGPRQGEGPFALDAAEIERHAPYVISLGARGDVPVLLQAADVFAFPTEYREGVPRVLLEAGLAGLPIVTTDMPGCNDVVTDGWNGHLVPARDPAALADRIVGLLQDREAARAMGLRSIELVRQRFDLTLVADGYAALYRQVLDASSSPGRPATILPAVPPRASDGIAR